MRKPFLLLAAGVLTLAGTEAFAAGRSNLHTMSVKLPDGGVATIEYFGNVAPKVDIKTGIPGELTALRPGFAFASFPDFIRMQAAMGRQMEDMLREARAMMAMPADPNMPKADFGAVPDANSSWFVSTSNGRNFCARSVEITVVNGKSTVRSHTEGNCGSSGGAARGSAHPDTVPAKSI